MNQVFRFICVSAALVASLSANIFDGSKSVNLALETSLLFEPEDSVKHLKFISEARKFLDKLEEAIAPQQTALRTSGNKTYLTNFLNKIVQVILEFPQDDLQNFFISLESEMRVHFYKGSIFRDIVYDPKVLTYVRNKLKEWTKTNPSMMRAKLNKYITSGRNKNTTLNHLGKFLNGYYDTELNEKMNEIVQKLRDTQEKVELEAIIRDAVNVLVTQHYDKMNYTTRAKLADEINKLSDYIKDEKIDVDDDLKLTFRKSLNDVSDASEYEIVKDNNIDRTVLNDTSGVDKHAEILVRAFDAAVEGRNGNKYEEKDDISVDNDTYFGQNEV